MIDSRELKRRDSYLNKLIGFQDTEPVKVMFGTPRIALVQKKQGVRPVCRDGRCLVSALFV